MRRVIEMTNTRYLREKLHLIRFEYHIAGVCPWPVLEGSSFLHKLRWTVWRQGGLGAFFHHQASKSQGPQKDDDFHNVSRVISCCQQTDKHIFTHTGEKLFKCDECNKYSNQPQNLRTHWLTHSGEKCHQCEQCNKAFSQAAHLNAHLLTHIGERPHKCAQCNYCSTAAGDLRIHLVTHTRENPHKCSQCMQLFNHYSYKF